MIENSPSEVQPVVAPIAPGLRQLTDAELRKVLKHQREHRLTFSESAARLGIAEVPDRPGSLSSLLQVPWRPPAAYAGPVALQSGADPYGATAKAVTDLRRRLQQSIAAGTCSAAISVVSPLRHDGRTRLAAELAASFALDGFSTVLVECDLRNPALASLLSLERRDGLAEILQGRPVAAPLQEVPGIPSLSVLLAGSKLADPLPYLASARLAIVMQELQRKFEVVLVDTPAAIRWPDAYVVAEATSGALVACRTGTPRRELDAVMQDLGRSQVPLAAVALIDH